MDELHQRLRSVRTRTVIETTVLEGNGTTESVAREVVRYHTPEGELLATRDPGERVCDYRAATREKWVDRRQWPDQSP